jgi:CheY-like chemotaxis protein
MGLEQDPTLCSQEEKRMTSTQTHEPATQSAAVEGPLHAGPTVLVVDDAPVDRHKAKRLVEKVEGWRAVTACNGAEALEAIEREAPTVVLTDMLMPEMDGLELVEAIRERHPLIPVILMTAFGSEDIAILALQKGAASYVPKKSLARDLADTLDQVQTAAKAGQQHQQLLDSLTEVEAQFVLESDAALVPALVAYLQDQFTRMKLCDQTTRIRLGVALEEALLNGIYHGNLEVSSELRENGDGAFHQAARERRQQLPYAERRLRVRSSLSRTQAEWVIADEGPGFDPSKLPDPTDPANLGRVGGRGLLLIRTFLDEVRFNQKGNEVTLIKRREPAHEARSCKS